MTTTRTLGVAAGAGLTSALLFAASAQGAGPALILAYVTPLPVMIATLGFGHATGLVAAAIAAGGLGLYLGLLPGLFFGLLLGFPAWWLPYLALLARPLGAEPATPAQGAPALMLWYPIGRVIAWAAAVVAAIILGLGAVLILRSGGFDAAVSYLGGRLDTLVGQTASQELSGTTSTRRVVQLLPVLMAASTFLMLVANLWLAGRVVERSGLLTRPWPALPENIRLPRFAVGIMAAAGVVAFAGGAVRVAGGVVVASFGMAFALQGLAAAHALTRGLSARRAILLAIYIIVLTVLPSILGLSILGVVDCMMPLHRRQKPVLPPQPRT